MEPFLNILIVEDNPGDVIIVNELIRSAGIKFKPTHASTLRDSLQACKRNEFDIILLDLGLPDSMGLQTLRQLREASYKSPLVVMTGLDDEDTALQALREGAQDYIVKNRLTEDIIIRTIKYSIERKKITDLEKLTATRFSILSTATSALNEMDDIQSTFEVICRAIRSLLNNAIVLAMEFPEACKVRFSGTEWLKPHYSDIQKITGFDLSNPVIEVTEKYPKLFESFENNKLKLVEGGLCEVFKGYLDRKACGEIEKLLDAKLIYTTGFHQHTVFYGGFIIISKDRICDADRNIIETIANQTSLNIHRRAIERHLRWSEERYRKLSSELEQKVKERTSDLELVNQQLQKELHERIQAEQALRKNQVELEELNATKDKFFNIVAHDLKNPFTSLLGSSELLYQNIGKLDETNIRKLANILNDSAKRGYAILQNLLDWSRSQTGMLKINPEVINLREIVEENIINLELFAANKEIKVLSNVRSDILIYADKNIINTVLRNLISNALKFSYRTGVVYINAKSGKKEIAISVKDSGIGISEEKIKTLFRIDTKHSLTGTENEIGTGLGLKLCKEFVEKHGGRIWVESEENKGSEFIFTIPVHRKNKKEAL